jgi:hypothetical protein
LIVTKQRGDNPHENLTLLRSFAGYIPIRCLHYDQSLKDKPMNKRLFIAALLTAFIAAVHIFAGGADVAAPLLASSLAEETRLTLYAVWHLVSVTLVLSAIALYFSALPHHAVVARYLALFISVLWLCFGAVFLVVAFIQPGEGLFFKMPQWILFLPAGLLGLWGCFSRPVR